MNMVLHMPNFTSPSPDPTLIAKARTSFHSRSGSEKQNNIANSIKIKQKNLYAINEMDI